MPVAARGETRTRRETGLVPIWQLPNHNRARTPSLTRPSSGNNLQARDLRPAGIAYNADNQGDQRIEKEALGKDWQELPRSAERD